MRHCSCRLHCLGSGQDLIFQKGVGVLVLDFENLLLSQLTEFVSLLGDLIRNEIPQGHQMDKDLLLSLIELYKIIELHKTSL